MPTPQSPRDQNKVLMSRAVLREPSHLTQPCWVISPFPQQLLILLCSRNCQVFFNSQVHPHPTAWGNWFHVSVCLCHMAPPLSPQAACLPPTCLPSSQFSARRALPVARLARPLRPQALLLPPCPLSGHDKGKKGWLLFHSLLLLMTA